MTDTRKSKGASPPLDKTAGVKLRAWMEPRVRASDLAREGGFRPSYVSAVLAGRKPPSERFLEAARHLGVPVDLILGLGDERAA